MITSLPKSAKKQVNDHELSPLPNSDAEDKNSPLEQLLEYKPQINRVDQELYTAILDENELKDVTITRKSTVDGKGENDSDDDMIEQYFEE